MASQLGQCLNHLDNGSNSCVNIKLFSDFQVRRLAKQDYATCLKIVSEGSSQNDLKFKFVMPSSSLRKF